MAGQSPAAAASQDLGKQCRSGPDGTVCAAVRLQDGHLYGRLGLDAAPNHILCTHILSLYHYRYDGLTDEVARFRGGPICAYGGHRDILTPAASSSCSSTKFYTAGDFIVGGPVGPPHSPVFSEDVLVPC